MRLTCRKAYMVEVSEHKKSSVTIAAVVVSKTMETISTTHFLKRDALYEVEKPYSLRFTPPSAFPPSNIKLTNHDIIIKDVRTCSEPLNFFKHGLQLLPFQSKLPYEQFDDDDAVKRIYLREVANLIKEFLGAQKVQIFEHTVRKRHAEFPISTGESYRWNQPTSIAHVDTTTSWAVNMARQLNPNKPGIENLRIQFVKYDIPSYRTTALRFLIRPSQLLETFARSCEGLAARSLQSTFNRHRKGSGAVRPRLS